MHCFGGGEPFFVVEVLPEPPPELAPPELAPCCWPATVVEVVVLVLLLSLLPPHAAISNDNPNTKTKSA